MLAALFIAVRLLFRPLVHRRPFVFAVTIISALSCLYIAGEEMSWGQHFFHWNTPEYWAMVNRQEETNAICTISTPLSSNGRGRSSRLAS
jgi:disulfide bond formation protein DsbB